MISTTTSQRKCTNRVLTDCYGRSNFQKRSGSDCTRFQNTYQHAVMLDDKPVMYPSLCISFIALKLMINNPSSIDTDLLLFATTSNVDVTIPTKFDLCYCNSSTTIIKTMLVITFGCAVIFNSYHTNAPEIYNNIFYQHFVDEN